MKGSKWIKFYVSTCGLKILYSMDRTQHGDLRHFSVSRPERYPNWDEILQVKNLLLGDIDAMMVMPKKRDYVNLSKNCFHVWETPKEWNIT